MPASFTNRPMRPLEWTTLFALSILWGASFFFIAVAVRELPPLTIVTARVVLAALSLYIVVRVLRIALPRTWRIWLTLLVLGVLNNVLPFVLIVWAQTHITGGMASILNATAPLFGVIVAHFFTDDEKLTITRAAGVVLGFCGVAVMVGYSARNAWNVDVAAQLATLGAAVSYAFAAVVGRRIRKFAVSPMAAAMGQVTASSVMMIPVMLLFDRPWTLPMPSAGALAAVAALAFVSTALAYVLYFRLLATAGATNLLLVTFLIPATALFLGTVVLREAIEPRQIAGMALIALGLAAVDGRAVKFLRGAAAAGG